MKTIRSWWASWDAYVKHKAEMYVDVQQNLIFCSAESSDHDWVTVSTVSTQYYDHIASSINNNKS